MHFEQFMRNHLFFHVMNFLTSLTFSILINCSLSRVHILFIVKNNDFQISKSEHDTMNKNNQLFRPRAEKRLGERCYIYLAPRMYANNLSEYRKLTKKSSLCTTCSASQILVVAFFFIVKMIKILDCDSCGKDHIQCDIYLFRDEHSLFGIE